jgi:hypothetical protein
MQRFEAKGATTSEAPAPRQGCQMVYFQTKNPNLGKFWSVLQWKKLIKFTATWIYFAAISYTLCPFGTVCGDFGILFPFWYVVRRKIWQPCTEVENGLGDVTDNALDEEDGEEESINQGDLIRRIFAQ